MFLYLGNHGKSWYSDVFMSTQIWEIRDFESGISWGFLGNPLELGILLMDYERKRAGSCLGLWMFNDVNMFIQ